MAMKNVCVGKSLLSLLYNWPVDHIRSRFRKTYTIHCKSCTVVTTKQWRCHNYNSTRMWRERKRGKESQTSNYRHSCRYEKQESRFTWGTGWDTNACIQCMPMVYCSMPLWKQCWQNCNKTVPCRMNSYRKLKDRNTNHQQENTFHMLGLGPHRPCP